MRGVGSDPAHGGGSCEPFLRSLLDICQVHFVLSKKGGVFNERVSCSLSLACFTFLAWMGAPTRLPWLTTLHQFWTGQTRSAYCITTRTQHQAVVGFNPRRSYAVVLLLWLSIVMIIIIIINLSCTVCNSPNLSQKQWEMHKLSWMMLSLSVYLHS